MEEYIYEKMMIFVDCMVEMQRYLLSGYVSGNESDDTANEKYGVCWRQVSLNENQRMHVSEWIQKPEIGLKFETNI